MDTPSAPEAKSETVEAPTPELVVEAKARAKSISKRRSSVVIPPSSATKSELTLLKELSEKTYLKQAQWFLNAYWSPEDKEVNFSQHPEECEKVWDMYNQMVKLDTDNGKEGNELDEHRAHIFLEKTTGAITVKKMREVLREVDVDFNSMVSLTEAMIYTYKIDYRYLVTAVVDDAEADALIAAAKAAVDAALERLKESQAAATAAAEASAAAKAAADEAKASAQKAKEEAEAAAVAEQLAVDEEARAIAEAEAATAAREAANAAAELATAARLEAQKAKEEADAAQVAAEASAAAAATAAMEAAASAEAAAASAAKAAEEEAVAKLEEEAAEAAEEKAQEIESVAKAAADELKVAVQEALDTQAELEAQQKALDDAKAAEQALIDDESVSNTKKMKAKIKLAGLESKDPLPLVSIFKRKRASIAYMESTVV